MQRWQPQIDQTATIQTGDQFVRLEYQGQMRGFQSFFSTINSLLNSPDAQADVSLKITSDLQEIRQPLPPTSLFPETIENLFVNSLILKQIGATFKKSANRSWHLNYKSCNYAVTFYPEIFEENPSLQLMSFGNPLFEEMLSAIDIVSNRP